MPIYIPSSVEGFELCQPVNSDDFEKINSLVNGVERLSLWEPLPMKIVHEDEGCVLVKSHSPWLGSHALIFRREVITALGELLGSYGELLPLSCNNDDLMMFNPVKVLDSSIDESRSSIVRFSNGRVMRINRYVFLENKIKNVHIFKIGELRVSPTFFSQHFVDLWVANGFKGIKFSQVAD